MLRPGYEPLVIGLTLMLFLVGCERNDHLDQKEVELAPGELTWIGEQVFRNECGSRETCLVHWNEGEAFPSLGIGHFIWYPEGVEGPYVESFPTMVKFLVQRGASLPSWLEAIQPFDAPWSTRKDLIQTSNMARVQELRDFLVDTRGLQAEFLVNRARQALGRIVRAVPADEQRVVSRRIEDLLRSPGGVYALIDYVNFKGEGLAETERYNGQGWGLLQVLREMSQQEEMATLQAFREAAARVLTRRADNASNEIEKQRWLPGWLNRIDTYQEPDRP